MGISSLGAGSSILTQDVLDQLRSADESKFVAPVDSKLKIEEEKSAGLDVVDALMDNVYESLKSLTEYGVFEARSTSSSNEDAVSVTALESSDVQDFTLEVSQLATKEIVQSGSFASRTSTISGGSGQMELAVGDIALGGETFSIDYTATTTLEDLKEAINKSAGSRVSATIVQVAPDDFRLILSAQNTGTGQEISITNTIGALNEQLIADPDIVTDPTNAVDGMTNVNGAVDALFKFNGVDITRTDNSVDDLLSGVTITLKEAQVGTIINVSVKQDREHIESKITNFVDKYNSVMFQLGEDTKSSQEVSERGVFSSDATIKGMRSSLMNMLSTVGEGIGRISDYGIELDEDGRLSLDATKLGEQLDKDPVSTQAFFAGGTFTKDDGSTVEMSGIFTEIETEVAKYSYANAVLDQFKDSMETRTDSLNEQREKAVQRLDSSYAIMQKRFQAYDAIISKFNSASNMFTQMVNAELAAKS